MNFLKQSFEFFVRGDPCLDLGEQILGDINGSRAAVLFVIELLGGMQRSAVMTAAGGSATAMGGEDEGGGHQRRGAGKPLEAGIEHAANQGRVVGHTHEGLGWHAGDR